MDVCNESKISVSSPDNTSQCSGRNILHFSDGTLDMDELDYPDCTETHDGVTIDPNKLAWAPWMWYYTNFAGNKALQVCDYLGEFFAEFFGITTPKYQYEITEYNRIKREEEQSKEQDVESNWSASANSVNVKNEPAKSEPEKFEVDLENAESKF